MWRPQEEPRIPVIITKYQKIEYQSNLDFNIVF